MEKLITQAIEKAVADYKGYLRVGFSAEKSLEMVRDESCFGSGSWNRFLSMIAA